MNKQDTKYKKEILFVPAQPYLNNELFNADNKVLNRDNTLYPGIKLKQLLQAKGYDCNTVDQGNIETAEWIVFMDTPKNNHFLQQCIAKGLQNKMILMLWEPPVVLCLMTDKKYHDLFRYVLTWNDDLVDNKKYFKFYWPQPDYDKKIEPVPFNKRKLLTLISGNKFSYHPKELYSERVKAINFFSRAMPEQFDFYGMGWTKKMPIFSKHPVRLLKNIIRRFTPIDLRRYKGQVEDKIETHSQYRFCICYENMKDINGYITEKIFDCFKAGCVPVYWGAENISDYIPAGCYIDKRDYSYNDLRRYLVSLDQASHEKYLANINQFMASTAFSRFSVEAYYHLLASFFANDSLGVAK